MSRQGRKKGRGSFSTDELNSLLDTLEAILPIEYEEWQQVVDAHDAHFPSTGRDVNSIKRKYCTLHRKKPPPGDPYCPPQVRQAKRIEYKIVNRAECGESEEDDDIVALEDVVEPTEVSATATISTTTRVVPTPSKKRSYNNRSGPDDVLTALLSQIQHKRNAYRKSQENQRDADRKERREDKKDEQDARRQDKKDMMLRMTQGKKRKKTYDVDRSDSDSD